MSSTLTLWVPPALFPNLQLHSCYHHQNPSVVKACNSHFVTLIDGIVDIPRADEIFCLYTAQNFTAATLVGFGLRKDTVECGQLEISNASGVTAASHRTGSILNSEVILVMHVMLDRF